MPLFHKIFEKWGFATVFINRARYYLKLKTCFLTMALFAMVWPS
jgi:hypothetical protein